MNRFTTVAQNRRLDLFVYFRRSILYLELFSLFGVCSLDDGKLVVPATTRLNYRKRYLLRQNGPTPGRKPIEQEGQHPLTGQRAANFRLLANQ